MVTRADVERVARSYDQVKFHHQGRVRESGVDCAGLLFCVAKDLGLPYEVFFDYDDVPDGKTVKMAVSKQMNELEMPPDDKLKFALPGHAVLFWQSRVSRHPQHLGVLGLRKGRLTLIHSTFDLRKVVECSMTEPWLGQMIGLFAFRGVEA